MGGAQRRVERDHPDPGRPSLTTCSSSSVAAHVFDAGRRLGVAGKLAQTERECVVAEEMRDHAYMPVADDNRTFVAQFIKAADLPAADGAHPIYSEPAPTSGMARESFKVTVIDGQNGAAGTFTVQERVHGVWVDKASIGGAPIAPNVLLEHNSDEQIRECRIKVVFTANPDGNPPGDELDGSGNKVGLYMEITGRRDR